MILKTWYNSESRCQRKINKQGMTFRQTKKLIIENEQWKKIKQNFPNV
jgi:hypothetical protein